MRYWDQNCDNKTLWFIFYLRNASTCSLKQRTIFHEYRTFLHSTGIATSCATPFNPEGNGQCESYNGTIWKTITLALKISKLSTAHWEAMTPDVLHSIRTLISVSTNCIPHERLFQYQRRSATECKVPSWLSMPGQVLIKIMFENQTMIHWWRRLS